MSKPTFNALPTRKSPHGHHGALSDLRVRFEQRLRTIARRRLRERGIPTTLKWGKCRTQADFKAYSRMCDQYRREYLRALESRDLMVFNVKFYDKTLKMTVTPRAHGMVVVTDEKNNLVALFPKQAGSHLVSEWQYDKLKTL